MTQPPLAVDRATVTWQGLGEPIVVFWYVSRSWLRNLNLTRRPGAGSGGRRWWGGNGNGGNGGNEGNGGSHVMVNVRPGSPSDYRHRHPESPRLGVEQI